MCGWQSSYGKSANRLEIVSITIQRNGIMVDISFLLIQSNQTVKILKAKHATPKDSPCTLQNFEILWRDKAFCILTASWQISLTICWKLGCSAQGQVSKVSKIICHFTVCSLQVTGIRFRKRKKRTRSFRSCFTILNFPLHSLLNQKGLF